MIGGVSTNGIWAVGGLDTTTIKQEANGVWSFALSLAEGIH